MKKLLLMFIVMTAILNSCRQERNSNEGKVSIELKESQLFIETDNQTRTDVSKQNNVDTKFVYANENGQELIIENSYPRGGLKYSDPMGVEYVYAVFWTRVTNNTSEPVELTMEFLEKSYQLPSAPDRIFKLLIPSDTLTLKKETLTNYGLDVNKYLNSHLHTQNRFKRTIKPNDSSGLYVVTLFNQGVNGTLRSGLKINGDRLLYRVNDKTIDCGEIGLKK